MAGVKPPPSSLMTPDLESAGKTSPRAASKQGLPGGQIGLAALAVLVLIGSSFWLYRTFVPPPPPAAEKEVGAVKSNALQDAFRSAPEPERFEQIQPTILLGAPSADPNVPRKPERVIIFGDVRTQADRDAARKIAEDVAKSLNLPLDFRVGLNFVTEP